MANWAAVIYNRISTMSSRAEFLVTFNVPTSAYAFSTAIKPIMIDFFPIGYNFILIKAIWKSRHIKKFELQFRHCNSCLILNLIPLNLRVKANSPNFPKSGKNISIHQSCLYLLVYGLIDWAKQSSPYADTLR